MFNGQNFSGWEGDTINAWRIENSALVAGSLDTKAPRNDFLSTVKPYTDFKMTFKFKLEGTEGFVNAGVQFRSERIDNPPHEMIGYQADIGAGYYGSLYDESRRKLILAGIDSLAASKIINAADWNDYEIIAKGSHIQLKINGVQTVDYTETDPMIPQKGKIAIQIHGNGKTVISYKDLYITEF